MASNEQSVTLLRRNKRAQVEALNSLGFDLTEGARASEFPQKVKWAAGLLDVNVAAVRISDGKNYYFTTDEWQSLSNEEQDKFLIRGVRVRAYAVSFIIAATTYSGLSWGSSKSIGDCQSFPSGEGLYSYYKALEETKVIAAAYKDVTANNVTGAPAAEKALAHKAFTAERDGRDDVSEWCLPTFAHLMIIHRYKTEIDAVFTAVYSSDYKIQTNTWHWSCCQYDSNSAYEYSMSNGQTGTAGKTSTGLVRPICLT